MLMMLAGCSWLDSRGTNEGAYLALRPTADELADALAEHGAPDEVMVAGVRLICAVDALGPDPCP